MGASKSKAHRGGKKQTAKGCSRGWGCGCFGPPEEQDVKPQPIKPPARAITPARKSSSSRKDSSARVTPRPIDTPSSAARRQVSLGTPYTAEQAAASSFGSDGQHSDSDDSDWDRFSHDHDDASSTSEGGTHSSSRESGADDGLGMSGRARQKEQSLFGVADKRKSAPLKETTSLKLAKLKGCTFVNQYVVIKYLGRGACGRVFLCMDMEDNRLYAVKIVKKMDLDVQRGAGKPGRRKRNPIDDLRREVAIMRTLRHKNIVSLQEVVDDPRGNKMLLVMDYMEGGPVMTREALERGRRIPESLALQYFRDMVKALDYLHYNKVVHGDLKPENVLMSARGNVTLSDFGCSKVIGSANEYLERCNGTPAFLAPEMMTPQSRYRGRPTDIYALGACLYTFVFGRIPFNAPNVFKLFQIVQTEPVRFPSDVPVSDDLKDLLLWLLVKNPKERITLQRVMRHPWVTRQGAWPLRSIREMLRRGENPNAEPVLPDLMATMNVLDVPRQDHLLEVLRPGLPERVFEEGQLLFRQGEHGTHLFYILEGACEVILRLHVRPESASSSSQRRPQRQAPSDASANGAPSGSDASERQSRSGNASTAEIIGDELPPALLEGASKAKTFMATLARGARDFLVALRSEGQFVGEMALFTTSALRCATVRAKGRVRVKVLTGQHLQECIDRIPEARQQVQEMVWMKQSENMVLEAMTRLAAVHDALEDLLRSDFSGDTASSAHQ
ncbi:hypothetical protein WJX72_002919 [[Myrmecia] bisecta]|uniref:Uncharacterized protein n=1 Tax=[Myrmecia] bisecta TaxID=41462 RepID=A0AAW1QPX1_9CHLO